MTLEISLKLVQVIIALAVFLQTLEFIFIKETFSERGVWRWSEIKSELLFLPPQIQRLFDFLLRDQHFIILLWIRLLAAILFIFAPTFILALILFSSSLFIAQRFRGSFNGGSDYMSLVILSALCVQAFFHRPLITKGVLWYIALQSTTSYFMAGFVKLKLNSWRKGHALIEIIQSPNYNPPHFWRELLSNKILAMGISWIVMLFEITFPIIFTQHNSNIIIWLSFGFLFHLNNFFLFGLNRFLFVWLATYPAIYLCALT